MIFPVIAAIAEWMREPTTGPNAYLDTIVTEDDYRHVAVPPFKRVLDPFRDESAFAGREPGAYPALVVLPGGPVTVEGEVNVDQLNGDRFPVQLLVVVEGITGPATLIQLSYLTEAVNRAISGFFADTPAAMAARQRRHVQLIACAGRSYALADEKLGAAKVGAMIVIDVTTRDTEAT